jgi:acetyl esterase
MPLHPEAVEAIRIAGDLPADLPPSRLRAVYSESRLKLLAEKPAVAITYELAIPTDYGPLPCRFYRPTKDPVPCPVMVYYHGGGFMLGTLELYDTTCRRLAVKSGCAVLSVGYRLAPETQFPGAVEDAYAAALWASRNASRLNIDSRRLVLAGDSAGGNLAAVVSQMAQDGGELPVALQVLIYPMTDMSRQYPSHERNASGYMLTTKALHWFIDNYVPDPADRLDPRASPILRPDLKGQPPALVISAEFDPLVDECTAYADRLAAANVAVRHVCFAGMIHPFLTLSGIVTDSAKAENLIAESVRAL